MSMPIQSKIEQFDLPHPSGTGTFRISVTRHPYLTDGMKDVPVLFVLDSDMAFALAAEIARVRGAGGMGPTAMVVGVGYGAASFAEFAQLRTADLTPPLSEAGKAALGKMTGMIGDKEGGAEALLTFLTDTLKPEILSRYPEASATNHSLYGHSLGGLFTSYALLTRPEAFATFIPSSPSLWWDGFAILARLPDFAAKLKAAKSQPRAYVIVGAMEQDIPTKVPASLPMTLEEVQALIAASRMVDAAAEFADSLREAGLKEVRHTSFEDEDHGTVIAPGLMRALVFAVPAE